MCSLNGSLTHGLRSSQSSLLGWTKKSNPTKMTFAMKCKTKFCVYFFLIKPKSCSEKRQVYLSVCVTFAMTSSFLDVSCHSRLMGASFFFGQGPHGTGTSPGPVTLPLFLLFLFSDSHPMFFDFRINLYLYLLKKKKFYQFSI